jgi:hemolysin III
MRPRRNWIRDPFCGLSHGAGAVLSIVGLVVLLILAQGRFWHTISFAIYGGCLVLLYTVSMLYHSILETQKHRDLNAAGKLNILDWLQRFDYTAIYAMIIGSYVPVCLITLRGAWGWTLLSIEVGLGVFGIVMSLFWKGAPDWLRVILYVGMGWLALVAIAPLRAALPADALAWLIGGGLVYSIGTIVYATDRPHLWPGKFSAHDLWHVFVMAGSLCHFILMCRFVAGSV